MLTALSVGVAGWQGWIALAIQWVAPALFWQVPAWKAAVVVLGVILASLAWHHRQPLNPAAPRETVRVVPHHEGPIWNEGAVGDRPAMQVRCKWFVTNIADRPIRLLSAHLTRLIHQRVNGYIMVRHSQGNIYGAYEITPGDTTEAHVSFWIQPPIRRVEQDFRASVTIVDHLGNQHTMKNVVFRGARPVVSQRAAVPEESLHAIANPIERQVAGVLKDEAHRYRLLGRPSGGLGSIRTVYRGQATSAFPADWRRTDAPERQSIVPDPEQAAIESDNATALLNLYRGLGSDEERSRFVGAMLRRLSRGTEYTPVGYLILLVLFRIGRLPDALRTARQDLQGDGELGFSDLMRLLDALLRFEHPAFTQELLDEAERFVDGIQEHTFSIRERIAAIGAFRLAQRAPQ